MNLTVGTVKTLFITEGRLFFLSVALLIFETNFSLLQMQLELIALKNIAPQWMWTLAGLPFSHAVGQNLEILVYHSSLCFASPAISQNISGVVQMLA